MSSTYSAELEVSASVLNGPECKQSRSAKSMTTATECCENTGLMCQTSEMFAQSKCHEDSPKSFAEASPAKTSARQEGKPGLKESGAACGPNMQESLATFDPVSLSWRTSQICLFGGLSEFSETWPRSGTMLNGIAYQLLPLVRLTDATVSGLWPTPLASETGFRRGKFPQGGTSLSTAIGGTPNPPWVEWLMGFPIGWTDLDH